MWLCYLYIVVMAELVSGSVSSRGSVGISSDCGCVSSVSSISRPQIKGRKGRKRRAKGEISGRNEVLLKLEKGRRMKEDKKKRRNESIKYEGV